MNQAAIDKMEEEIKADVDKSIEYAMASPEPKAEDVLRYVFVEED